jgi:hypothetical protein
MILSIQRVFCDVDCAGQHVAWYCNVTLVGYVTDWLLLLVLAWVFAVRLTARHVYGAEGNVAGIGRPDQRLSAAHGSHDTAI